MKNMKYPFRFFKLILIFPLGIFVLISTGCSFISVTFVPTVKPLRETTISGSGDNKILMIDISGIISEDRSKGLLEITESIGMVARIKEELSMAAKDKHIKAVILRINSPGGTVTASDMIYHEIKKFKEKTDIAIIANIMDLGTSGGYYIAVAADKIIAHPTTVTGSIGVIMLNLSIEGLLQKVGIEDASIKTGEHKDMGSPLKHMTDEDRKIFQGVLNTMYDRFLGVIVENRKPLSREKLIPLADGRIYTAQQALEYGLIDQIGYLDETVSLAQKETGLKEAQIIVYRRPGVYKNNIYSQLSRSAGGDFNLFNIDLKTFVHSGAPSFMYLWSP